MTIRTEEARAGRAARRVVPWPALEHGAGVTVVIPTRNEEGLIAEIIEAVRPHAAEILVVDGHSTDRTERLPHRRARGSFSMRAAARAKRFGDR